MFNKGGQLKQRKEKKMKGSGKKNGLKEEKGKSRPREINQMEKDCSFEQWKKKYKDFTDIRKKRKKKTKSKRSYIRSKKTQSKEKDNRI